MTHLLASSSPSKIELRTPLTRANTAGAQLRGARSSNRRPATDPQPAPTCRTCGVALTERRRQLCAACWPITRRQLAAQRATTAHAALAALRASGQDPTTTPQAADKRSASLSKRKRQQLAWQPNPDDNWTPERYQTEILPRLAALPLSALAAATGLSLSACSRIRSGKLTPHRRHWAALLALPQG